MRKAIFWVMALAAVTALCGQASGQAGDAATKGILSPDNWQVDVFGGWTSVNPGGVNMFPAYYEKTIPFLTLQSYQYTKQVFGNLYVYSASFDARNSFKKITGAYPVGFAVRYHVDARLDVSFGLSYMTRQAGSFYHATFTTSTIPPNAYGTWGLDDIDTRDLTYENISVSVRCWVPAAGIHYRVFSSGIFSGELEASAGPAFASFTTAYHSFDKYTFPDAFWFGFEEQLEGHGKGIGIAVAGGGRVGVRLLSRLEVFASAAYQFVSVPTLTGTRTYGTRYLDKESKPPEFTTTELTGTWRSYPATLSRNWGRLTLDNPVISSNPSQYPNGVGINLSGVSLRVGVSVRL